MSGLSVSNYSGDRGPVSNGFSPAEALLARLEAEGVAPASEGGQSPTMTFFPHNGGRFEVSADGVFFVKDEKSRRVCDELRVEAKTRDGASGNWGRLLTWRDADGKPHRWSMPMELLQGEPSDVARELASGGLHIAPGQARLLADYLQACPTEARVKCVAQTGWHDNVYCTPTETVGSTDTVSFQGASSGGGELAQKGSLEEWRDKVAALAAGNSRLVFSLSCAFAGPLLHLAGVESGGFHLVGASSSGKTTALGLAATVWGHPKHYVRTWRATSNGLEGIAALHNDGLLILDELGQCDPKQAGEAAYMLANGKGKARASRSGGARAAAEWRLLFLSSGEVKLETLLEGDRKRVSAGQVLRMASISMDAGAGLGGFERLHGSDSPGGFAQRLTSAGEAAHGAVGMEWLRRVASDLGALPKLTAAYVEAFVQEAVPSGASGQVGRVARRFGIVAAAGELATEWRLTGWRDGEAQDAALACFRAWLGDHGAGQHEERAVCEQVRLFLESNGSSRFQRLDDKTGERVPKRAGYFRDIGEEPNTTRQYLVPAATFKAEVIQGRELKSATAALVLGGLLIRGKDKMAVKVRVPELGKTLDLYCLVIPEEVTE